jgi:hypothetical protein
MWSCGTMIVSDESGTKLSWSVWRYHSWRDWRKSGKQLQYAIATIALVLIIIGSRARHERKLVTVVHLSKSDQCSCLRVHGYYSSMLTGRSFEVWRFLKSCSWISIFENEYLVQSDVSVLLILFYMLLRILKSQSRELILKRRSDGWEGGVRLWEK